MAIGKHNLQATKVTAARPDRQAVLTFDQRESVMGKLEEIGRLVGKATSPDELAAAAYGATDLARDLNCYHHEAMANGAGVVGK